MEFCKTVIEAPLGNTYLFSVGQAGFIIKNKKGKLLGIDLYLSDYSEKDEGNIGFKRLLPKILSPRDIKFDYLIATHPHSDHYDYDSMTDLMINGKTKLFASRNCKVLSVNLGISSNAQYVSPGDQYIEDGFIFDFINCDHGIGAPDAVGVIVTVDGFRIMESGDTCLRLDRVAEYLKKGALDVMIAPINGAYGNLNEIECADLSGALNPRLTIPCHYGMFARHGGSPWQFVEYMNKTYPDNKYLLMTQGESLAIDKI